MRAHAASIGDDAGHLGNAFLRLGERESGTAQLEEAVAAFQACLQVAKTWPAEWVQRVRSRRDTTQAEIARRRAKISTA